MRKPILILSALICSLHLFSQDALLKTFKYRIDHYRAISFITGGGTQWMETGIANGKNKSGSSYGNFNGSYYAVSSTDKRLFTLTAALSSGAGWNKNRQPNESSNNRSLSFLPAITLSNKMFRGKDFLELGADALTNIQRNSYTTNSMIGPRGTAKLIRDEFNVAITIGIGRGRLENITNMQNALWLYQDLRDEQRLNRSLTDDELNELGQAITLGNNTRILDARRRTRFMLETTDKFFQQKNVLTTTDIKYFGALNDILFFAINMPRLSGTEVYLRLTPSINQARFDDLNEPVSGTFKGRYDKKTVLLSAGISSYRPVNLRHQNNYGITLELSYTNDYESDRQYSNGILVGDLSSNPILKQADVDLFFEHAIYPNTRTIISFRVDSEAGYQDLEDFSGFFGTADLVAAASYFVSYRTRLTCSVTGNYLRNMNAFGFNHHLVQLPNILQVSANIGIQVDL